MKSHKMMASYTNVFVSNTNFPPLMTFSFVLMHSVGFEIHHLAYRELCIFVNTFN